MRVRKALPEDAEVITNINVETWKVAYKGLMDDDILDNRKADDKRIAHWKEVIENPSLLVLVCEDKEILGYLCAGKARDDYGIKNEVYALYVLPCFQRKGAGAALLRAYKEILRGESFYLYMLKGNQKAGDFYSQNGGKIFEKFARNITVKGHTIEEVCYVFE